ncbi:MAG TPA: peptide-methionine (S)-S-oxide reductase MsrA, partial [Bryobacteraceae bacterium]|nr:peptide-methionine (S)-S-oxide reductase MsrA [Bryobacteraceae bacterium]
PAVDLAAAPGETRAEAVLAGGCYWGMQAVFEKVRGVISVTAGYAGAAADPKTGKVPKDGGKGHAEAVRIVYDPGRVSYGVLLEVFFAVAHDPTEVNRQGPDIGSEYRSAIFYQSDAQKRVAESYIRQIDAAKSFPFSIVTQMTPFAAFYPVGEDQQDYVWHNPGAEYVVKNDLPKLAKLRMVFPDLFEY